MTFLPLPGARPPPARRARSLTVRNAAVGGAAAVVIAAFAVGLSLAATGAGSSGGGAVASQVCYMTLLALSMAVCLARGLLIGEERGAWLTIALGLALWWVGDAAFWLSPSPPALLEGISYFGFYGAAGLGMILLVRASDWQHRELLDVGIVLAGTASLWSWLVLEGVTRTASAMPFEMELAYPLADLVLAAAALVLFEAVGWRLSSRWLLLSGGFIAIAVADSIYLVQVAGNGYVSGTVLDFLWPAGTVAVAGAAWLGAPARRRWEARSPSYLVATGALVAVFAMLFADHFHRISSLSLGLAGLTLVLAIARSLVTHFHRLTAERSLRAEATHTVHALAEAVDAKDPYTRNHSRRVSIYARAIAERLGMPTDRLERIAVGGQLHDVGKIAVPDAVLLKVGALSDPEFELIKKHAAEGERIVGSVGLADLAPWIRHHHERWDGGGYPDRLCGEESPIEARILAAADSLDAMTCTRSYRPSLSIDEARSEIATNAARQFDPAVTEVVLSLIDEGVFPLVDDPGPSSGTDAVGPPSRERTSVPDAPDSHYDPRRRAPRVPVGFEGR